MTPNPVALAVLLDAARACYGDDSEQVRWLENAEALSDFLRVDYLTASRDDDVEVCVVCGGLDRYSPERGHERLEHHLEPECKLLGLWRALRDERYQSTIDQMFERWCTEETRRAADLLPYTARTNASMVAAFATRTPLEALAAQAFAADLSVSDNIFEPVRVEPLRVTQHRYVSPFRLASESEQAAEGRSRLRAAVRADQERTRAASDARGMEAVEDEARRLVSHVELPF